MTPAPQFTIHHSLFPILHEALLRAALAAIPIGATIIHPALGIAAALATAALLTHLNARRTWVNLPG